MLKLRLLITEISIAIKYLTCFFSEKENYKKKEAF